MQQGARVSEVRGQLAQVDSLLSLCQLRDQTQAISLCSNCFNPLSHASNLALNSPHTSLPVVFPVFYSTNPSPWMFALSTKLPHITPFSHQYLTAKVEKEYQFLRNGEDFLYESWETKCVGMDRDGVRKKQLKISSH